MNEKPQIKPQNVDNPFLGYVAKSIPLAFDESLSYYEVLCNLKALVGQTINSLNNTNDGFIELQNLFNELEDYVNHYFDNLDIQEEVNTKIDIMATDGTITNLIKNYVDPIQSEFENDMNENYQNFQDDIDDTINNFKTEVNGNLNDFENNINTQDTKIDVLEGRMDTFTNLAEGSTTGDAELTDIRIDINGTTHSNAGNSVRSQVKQLNDKFPIDVYSTKFFTLKATRYCNVLDLNNVVVGYCLGRDNAISNTPVIREGWCYTDYLPIPKDGRLQFSRLTNDGTARTIQSFAGGVLLYDANKEFISGAWGAHYQTPPDSTNQYYARFTFNYNSYVDKQPMIEVLDTHENINTSVDNYKDPEYEFLYNPNIPTDYYENVEINLPSIINATIGHEISLEYYNIVKCSDINEYVITSNVNNSQIQNLGNKLRINPTTTQNTQITLSVTKNNKTITSKKFNLVVKADTYNQNMKAIFLGDSMTNAGYFIAELKRMLGNSLTLYGTRQSNATDSLNNTLTVLHEGRAGWRTSNYIRSASYNGMTNPFYNNETFDFSYYMNNNPNFNDVTDVFILLGTNDGSSSTFDTDYQTICESIKNYDTDIKIHCLLPIPPINSGYAWGTRNYTHYKTFKDYMFNNAKKIINLYNNTEGYSIIPTNANIDCWYDFPKTQVSVNSRNPETIEVGNDNVHPNKYGYYRMSDVIYCDIVNN